MGLSAQVAQQPEFIIDLRGEEPRALLWSLSHLPGGNERGLGEPVAKPAYRAGFCNLVNRTEF